MIINNNISSLTATNALAKTESAMNKSIQKLSSGLRINKAADDAAGLAVSEKMRSQIRGLDVAKRNTQDGISLVQTAEGSMDEIHNMLQRLRELNVQAVNGIYTTQDTAHLKTEATELLNQITDIANKSNFNGVPLLNGGTAINIQVGIKENDKIVITPANVKLDALKITGLDITDKASLAKLDEAIQIVSTNRAKLGAIQNRLEHTLSDITNTHENLTVAESRIRDVDMAKEMANYSSKQVLLQAGMSVAAQANSKTSMVTKLIG